MMNLKVELKQGRKIHLYSFYQISTYAGLLEGKPNAWINGSVLEGLQATAQRIFPSWPLQILGIDHYKTDFDKELPPILCIAHFISHRPIQPDQHGSSLILAWFQNEMFPLLQGQNAVWASEVDWNKHAQDFEY